MVKYLKHFYVDGENKNEFLINSNYSRSGKTHPPIKSLDVKVRCKTENGIEYCLSFCSEDVAVTETEGLTILSEQKFIEEVKIWFDRKKEILIKNLYEKYKVKFENSSDNYYSMEEKLLFLEKYKESIAILNDENVENAPILVLESLKTDTDLKVLAQKIKNNFENYLDLQIQIITERKKSVDYINSVVFDNSSVDQALNSILKL